MAGATVAALLTTVFTPGVSAAAETVNWSAQSTVPNAGTSATPAMTTCNGLTYLVWKGSGNDDNMYFSVLTDAGWAPQRRLGGGGGTSTGPTVACDWNQQIVVAWRGIDGDQRIWYTAAQVESGADQPTGPLQWSAQKIVDGGGVTDLSPSLAVVRNGSGGLIYLAWKGAGSDTSVHYATLSSLAQPWQVLGTVPGVSTVRSPTLTAGLSDPAFAPTLSLVWPLPGGQNIYYTNYFGGSSWSNPAPIVGGSAAAPVATEGVNDGYSTLNDLLAWQGSGNDTRIFYTVDQDRSGWQPQQLVTNGGPTGNGLAAADYVQCPNGHCTVISAYLAWEGPQQQIEYVHGQY
jgi:hypothetical protein